MLTRSTSPRRATRIAALGLAFLLLLAAVLAAAPALAGPPAPTALIGSVEWDPTGPKIVSNGQRIAYPWVTVGPNDVTHIIYFTVSGEVMYTNNESGAFNIGGKRLDSAGTPQQVPVAAIAVGPGNVIGIVYVTVGRDNTVYYRQSTDGGRNWTPKERISSGEKAASPHLAFDSAANAHMVWIDDRCGPSQYNVYYRIRYANGIKPPSTPIRPSCGTYQNRPQITIAGGKPQVTFQHGSSKGSEIYYARLEGSTWVNQNISGSNNASSQNTSITSDGDKQIFIAWDENVDNANHEIYLRSSFNGGLNWTDPLNMSNGSAGISTAPHVVWSPSAQRVHVVWQDEHGGASGDPEIWERQFSPVSLDTTFADQISHFSRRSMWPTVGAGTKRADVVWQDEVQTYFQVWDWAGEIIGGQPGCEGSLTLNGGAAATRDRTLSGTITPANNCVPDQMQISLDTPVTDATPKVAYSASLPLQTVPEGGCVHTVYVRLFRGGGGGTPFSDNIQVDSEVQASVRITNPHLDGQPNTGGAPGAQDGDPRYTRDLQFYLGIDGPAECSGLQNFSVQGGSNGAIADNSYADVVQLPGGSTPAARDVNVTVTDKIGNSENYQATMIFDSGPPTLVMTSNPTVTMPLSTTNIIVPLSFQNITVNDATYGTQGENLDQGERFWGVWIANSRTSTAPTDPDRWSPVEVPTHASDFTIDWSLFGNLGDQANPTGDYYVFVRFLDGAGNPTTAVIQTAKITLESDFTMPTLYLPNLHKE
jgi:hypothetical protein